MGTAIKFIIVLIPSALVIFFLLTKFNAEMAKPLHENICPRLSEEICKKSIVCQPMYAASSCVNNICTMDMVYKGCR